MSITLRILLIVISILTCAWMLHQIKKARVKIEDSVFWILFSGFLSIIGIFPGIAEWGASIVGVFSTVNFVFLSVLFILIVKLFRQTIKVSQLENKIQTLAQRYAEEHLDVCENERELQNLK